jgi:predicted permease
MLGDIRYALRGFRRSPGFTSTAVVSLALGIGANTAIFSLVNAILWRKLPVREPDRLVIFTLSTPERFFGSQIPLKLYEEIRDKSSVLAGFAGFGSLPMTLSGGGSAERVNGQIVSGNYFDTLGVNAQIGRVLTTEDDRVPNAHPVCVISYGLWMRRFGGDRDMVGRTILINGHPLTVIGVTPKEFSGITPDSPIDVSIPLAMASLFQPFRVWLEPFGRLKPGVNVEQAQSALNVLYHQLQRQTTSGIKVSLEPGGRGLSPLRDQYERPLVILMAVVGLVLLIACANVTNLLMARASGRSREIAVRLALGAQRARLVRLLLTESMLLTIGGAVLGTALAYSMDRALVALATQQVKGSMLIVDVNRDVSPDWRVFLFTTGVAALVGLICGIAPALRSTQPDVGPALKGASGVRAPGRFSFANALVVAQAGFSVVLLTGAGLFLRSFHNLKSVDPGFDPRQMVVLTVEPRWNGYSAAAIQSYVDRLVEQARKLPGVMAASPGSWSPLSGLSAATTIEVPGFVPRSNELWSVPDPQYPWMIPINYVGQEYFAALGAPLVAGREFTEQDGFPKKVAIVNEKTAAHYWPHESPIGKHILMGGRREAEDCEIVGVVKDLKSESLRKDAPAIVYMPLRQHRTSTAQVTLHVRVAGPTKPVISALLSILRGLDPNLAATNLTTMEEQLGRTIASDRLVASLTALFGLLALAVAAVGLYGVMAFAVAARTREIGIRMALGATHGRVLRRVMAESAALTAVGIALGVPGAMWVSRGIGSFLYGLSATDPWTYAMVTLVLAGVALSASWIPARRAARVDPMVALRYE